MGALAVLAASCGSAPDAGSATTPPATTIDLAPSQITASTVVAPPAPDACDPASASVHSVRTREARNDELCRGELTPQRGFKLVMKHQRKRARYGPDFKRVLERATGLEPATFSLGS